MIRHFNSTQRQTIQQRDIQIELRPAGGSDALCFDLRMQLDRYEFPPDARVRVEAWRGNAAQRWDYGAVADLRPPPEQERRMIEAPQSSQFKVFVVAGDGSGKLLGLSRAIKPKQPRESLIPLVPCDLNDEVWRVEFSDDDLPELQVNSKLELISEIVRSDAQFRALVMPQVLRSVLTHIIFVLHADPDDDDGGWPMGWFRLAQSLERGEVPKLSEDAQGAPVEQAREWIERVVAAFASQRVDAVKAYAEARPRV